MAAAELRQVGETAGWAGDGEAALRVRVELSRGVLLLGQAHVAYTLKEPLRSVIHKARDWRQAAGADLALVQDVGHVDTLNDVRVGSNLPGRSVYPHNTSTETAELK